MGDRKTSIASKKFSKQGALTSGLGNTMTLRKRIRTSMGMETSNIRVAVIAVHKRKREYEGESRLYKKHIHIFSQEFR